VVVRVVRRDPNTRQVLMNREGYLRLGFEDPQDCTVVVRRNERGELPRTVRVLRSEECSVEREQRWHDLELSGLHGAPPVYVELP